MSYEEKHQDWLHSHISLRSGERKDRLKRGHGHGERLFLERVWWPLFGHFENLHPEYEVTDWRGQPYFIDFVWIKGYCKFAFEIKGYGPHVQNTDRTRYRRELNREIFLQTLGFRVVAIPYDELEVNPQVIVFLIKSLLAPYMTLPQENQYSLVEREILLCAMQMGKDIRPAELVRKLQVNKRTVLKSLKKLSDDGKLKPVISEESGRMMKYEWIQSLADDTYW